MEPSVRVEQVFTLGVQIASGIRASRQLLLIFWLPNPEILGAH
jgi:hypothetical protein